MSIFERFLPPRNDQIKSADSVDASMLDIEDPLANDKLELKNEVLALQEQAGKVAMNPTPVKIETLKHNLKDAELNASTACNRKYGYNPPQEMINLYSQVEHFLNGLTRKNIKDVLTFQDAMKDFNKIIGSSDIDEIKGIIKKYNNKVLQRTGSHPGILSKNEIRGFEVKFSDTDSIKDLKKEASNFYSMCESEVQKIFIYIQKLFNDLLSIFDTSKGSLKNDARGRMVNNQQPR